MGCFGGGGQKNGCDASTYILMCKSILPWNCKSLQKTGDEMWAVLTCYNVSFKIHFHSK